MGFGRKKNNTRTSASNASNTLHSEAIAQVDFLLSEGPIEGFIGDPLEQIYLDNTPIRSGGIDIIPEIEIQWRTGASSDAPLKDFSRALPYTVGVDLNHNDGVVRSIAGELERVWITIQINRLYRIEEGTNVLKLAPMEITIERATAGNGFETLHRIRFFDKTDSPYQQTFGMGLPSTPSNSWAIRVTKQSGDLSAEEGASEVQWATYTTIGRSIESRIRSLAVLQARIDSDAFSGFPAVAMDVGGLNNLPYPANNYVGNWTGELIETYHNNPAWFLYWLLTQPRSGQGFGVDPGDLDLGSFYRVAERCNKLLPSLTSGSPPEPRYTYNRYLTVEISSEQWKDEILGSMHAYLSPSGNRLALVQDAPGAAEFQVTSADFIVEVDGNGNESDPVVYQFPSLDNISTVVTYDYLDSSTWEYNTIKVQSDEAIARYGYYPKAIKTERAMPAGEAYRAARWELESSINYLQVTFVMGEKGLYHRTGQIVSFTDITLAGANGLFARHVGRVDESNTTNVLVNFEVLDIPAGQVIFSYSHPDTGEVVQAQVSSINTEIDVDTEKVRSRVNFTSSQSNPPIVGSPWTIRSSATEPRIFTIMELEPRAALTEFKVVAFEVNNDKWAYIDNVNGDEKLPSPLPDFSPPSVMQDFRAIEELIINSEQFTSRMSLYWAAKPEDIKKVYYWEVEIRERGIAQWTSFNRVDHSGLDIVGLDPGDYDVRIRGVSVNQVEGPWRYEAFAVRRGIDSIPNVQEFKINDGGAVVSATWSEQEGVRLSGLFIEIRFTEELDNPSWEAATVIARAPAINRQKTIDGQIGTYFAKYVVQGGTALEQSAVEAVARRASNLYSRVRLYNAGQATWEDLTGEREMFGSLRHRFTETINETNHSQTEIITAVPGELTIVQAFPMGTMASSDSPGYVWMNVFDATTNALLDGYQGSVYGTQSNEPFMAAIAFPFLWRNTGTGGDSLTGDIPTITSNPFAAPTDGRFYLRFYYRVAARATSNHSVLINWFSQNAV